MKFSSVCAALVALTASAAARSTSNKPFESLRAVPEGWELAGSPKPDTLLKFRIGVTRPSQSLFEQTLLEISTPGHKNYGKHMKRNEITNLLRPAATATNSIMQWLEASGASHIQDEGDWIKFHSTAEDAEKMLNTEFNTYRSTVRDGVSIIRTLQYSVPQDLQKYIDLIQPTTRFHQIRQQRSQVLDVQRIGMAKTGLNVTACNSTITPTCLKELYSVTGFTADPAKGGFLGVNGFLEEYARYSDLATFESEYAPYAVGKNFTWTSINGGLLDQNSTADSVEANLDIQYTVSLSYPLNNNFYSTGGRGELVPDLDQPSAADNQNEPYADFLDYILAVPEDELPTTLSTSYGEDEQSVPESYARRVCDEFGKLGMMGVSVLFSSGDTGVGSACQTNDGKNTTRFLPIFPAACPYVTSVGGTHYVNPESAIYFSSGGFSDLFPRPAYQDTAVSDYLKMLGSTWAGLYNPAGRGFPDIAAQSSRFHVVDKGAEILVGGTSASAPTVSAIIALLNAARKQSGAAPLGFLNPWLYSTGYKGLTDIVNGGSTGCTGVDIYSGLPAPFVPYASWNATKGWDPVTGYGTPNFRKLLALAGVGRFTGLPTPP